MTTRPEISDMTYNQQLAAWCAGNSVHIGTTDEGWCTPDFSCCRPELGVPLEVRERFLSASENERHRMMSVFLKHAVESMGSSAKVHISGGG